MGNPVSVLPPINVALYPLLLLVVAPFDNARSEDNSFVTGRPPDNIDVLSIETLLLSRIKIQLVFDSTNTISLTTNLS